MTVRKSAGLPEKLTSRREEPVGATMVRPGERRTSAWTWATPEARTRTSQVDAEPMRQVSRRSWMETVRGVAEGGVLRSCMGGRGAGEVVVDEEEDEAETGTVVEVRRVAETWPVVRWSPGETGPAKPRAGSSQVTWPLARR